jgi:DNA-binding NarL/FixJ family response regulator
MQALKILIIEDHHLMVEGYKQMLSYERKHSDNIIVANNCETAFNILKDSKSAQFDLVFLDWSLPSYENEKLYDGGDLVKRIRLHSPFSNLIILTSHTEAFVLYRITKEINPNALLCKIDFMIEDFSLIYRKIMLGELFYSKTVTEQLRKITSHPGYLDNLNRQIITLLSKGIKTKNLPQYLPLSISAIDKRKSHIKDYFLINNGNDEDIIRAAKKAGLL